MTRAEWVTDFKLDEADGQPITFSALVEAVKAHCKEILDGESFCDVTAWGGEQAKGRRLPARWRSLIAFALDGDCEGYYVHIGVMVDFGDWDRPGQYLDAGFAKVWTAEQAQKLATEAQRFLSAARWN
jgi:hypothetical protein